VEGEIAGAGRWQSTGYGPPISAHGARDDEGHGLPPAGAAPGGRGGARATCPAAGSKMPGDLTKGAGSRWQEQRREAGTVLELHV
jgi:hypothetical protein